MRTLLSTLVAKQNEIQVSSQLGGLRTSNIKVVDRALVPPGPFTPNVRRNLLMALLVGLFGGLGLIFLVEYLDNTVKGPEDVEKLAGLPSLGIIPYLSAESPRKRAGRLRLLPLLRVGGRQGRRRPARGPGDRAHQPPLPQVLDRRGLPDGPDLDPLLPRRQHAEDDRLHQHPAPGGQVGHDLQPGRLVRPARGQGPAHRRRPAQAAPEQDLQPQERHRPQLLPRRQGLLRRGRPEDEHRQRLDDPQRPASAQPGRAAELEADEGAPGPGQGRVQRRPSRHAACPGRHRPGHRQLARRFDRLRRPGREDDPAARSSGPSRRSASPRPTSSASSSTRSASGGRGSGRPSTTTMSTSTTRRSRELGRQGRRRGPGRGRPRPHGKS